MPNEKSNDELDQIEEELRRKAEKQQKEDMPVSGRSVFELQKILRYNSENKQPDEKK